MGGRRDGGRMDITQLLSDSAILLGILLMTLLAVVPLWVGWE